MPCILPIWRNDNHITDFKEKAETFNSFFAKQCTIVNNTSKHSTNSFKRANNCLSMISFTKDDIVKIIKNLDSNRAYCHDMICIRMLKICGESILKLSGLIFNPCIKSGKFTIEWKKVNVAPVHKNWQTTKRKLS